MGMQTAPAQLFYDFCLDDHVPDDHLLRRIDRFLDLQKVRTELKPFYSNIGRPSIDPELMMRMLIVGYCMGIRSERRLCDEIHLILAYRWFCRLGLDGRVPDHSTLWRFRADALISPLPGVAPKGRWTDLTVVGTPDLPGGWVIAQRGAHFLIYRMR